jgi:dihydroorotase
MKPLAILNGRVVDPEAGSVTQGGILVRDRRIAAVGRFEIPADAETLDARGALIAPGLVDVGSFAIDLPAFTAGGD